MKPSIKDFEKACRSQVLQNYDEVNEKKLMKILLPLMIQKYFYEKLSETGVFPVYYLLIIERSVKVM